MNPPDRVRYAREIDFRDFFCYDVSAGRGVRPEILRGKVILDLGGNMPEDTKRGFFRFQTDEFQFLISNEQAWNAPGLNKRFDDDFPGNFALANLGNAVNAVGAAATRKALRDQPDQQSDIGDDVVVEDFSLLDIL